MEISSSSTPLEKVFLPVADQHDLTKSTARIFWENRKCAAMCILIYLCSLSTGYENIISNSVLNYESFMDRFGVPFDGRKEISASFQQGIQALSTVGSGVATLIAWWISDRWLGRISMGQIGLAAGIVAVVLEIVAPNPACYCAGRFFIGVGDATMRYGIFLWVVESAIPPMRGAATGLFFVNYSIGGIVGQIVSRVYSTGESVMQYRIPMIIGLGPQVLSLFLLYLLPESPRYLLMLGKDDAARQSLHKLRSGEHRSDEAIESEVTAMRTALALERTSRASQHKVQDTATERETRLERFKQARFFGAFKGPNKHRMLAAVVAGTFLVSTGFLFTATSQAYLLRLLGERDPFKYALIGSCCGLAGSLLNVVWVAENVGRRKLVFWGFFISGCSMGAIGVAFVVPQTSLTAQKAVLNAFFDVMQFVNNISVSTIAHAIANEVPTQEYRSVASSLHWFTYFATSSIHGFIQPYWINPTELDLSGKISWLYVVTGFLSLLFCYFIIPESRGVSLEEMDLLYRAHGPAWRSRRWIEEHRRKVGALT